MLYVFLTVLRIILRNEKNLKHLKAGALKTTRPTPKSGLTKCSYLYDG